MSLIVKSSGIKLMKIVESRAFKTLKIVLIGTTLMFLWSQAFADSGSDPLAGTDASLIATLGSNGTGRKFLYLVEGIFATVTFIKTKNPMLFSGVVAIAIFLNILFKVAGVGA